MLPHASRNNGSLMMHDPDTSTQPQLPLETTETCSHLNTHVMQIYTLANISLTTLELWLKLLSYNFTMVGTCQLCHADLGYMEFCQEKFFNLFFFLYCINDSWASSLSSEKMFVHSWVHHAYALRLQEVVVRSEAFITPEHILKMRTSQDR